MAETQDAAQRRARRIRIVEEHVRLENVHDLEGIMGTFGRDGCYEDLPWGDRRSGLDGVRGYYAELLRAAPDFHIEVKRTFASDDEVILEVQLRGTATGPWRGLPGTGRRFDFPLCAVFSFDENDRLAGERIYYDRATVLVQLGVLHEPEGLATRILTPILHPLTILRALARLVTRRAA